MMDGINMGLLIIATVFGFLTGFLYSNYSWVVLCLRAVLIILWRIEKRGVFISPYDRAVINIAHKAAGGK